MRALAYVRVSREREDPGNQVRAIAEWATRSGVKVLSYYVSADVSGATRPKDRPRYRAMLEAAKALGTRLLLFHDRLSEVVHIKLLNFSHYLGL
ncbi:MAG: recombinase family protein [Desulfurococcaceae archaeon]|nr:recombinase family protein [Desulfurococcaceae archaeon]